MLLCKSENLDTRKPDRFFQKMKPFWPQNKKAYIVHLYCTEYCLSLDSVLLARCRSQVSSSLSTQPVFQYLNM